MASDERHLGLGTIYRDHRDSWTTLTGSAGRRQKRRTGWFIFGMPLVPAAFFTWCHVGLVGLGQLLSGVTVFTALLFGLLILMFNTGVTLRKDGAVISNAHGLKQLVSDIRANTTWAIVVGLVLAGILVVAAATTDPARGAEWWYTPLVVYLFGHLVLNLLMILRRLRTAFNYITR